MNKKYAGNALRRLLPDYGPRSIVSPRKHFPDLSCACPLYLFLLFSVGLGLLQQAKKFSSSHENTKQVARVDTALLRLFEKSVLLDDAVKVKMSPKKSKKYARIPFENIGFWTRDTTIRLVRAIVGRYVYLG